jgi:hypothetical protein
LEVVKKQVYMTLSKKIGNLVMVHF